MKALRKIFDKIKPHFEKGGKLQSFYSVFEGFETFLFVSNETSKSGVHIHDARDSKRTMIIVVMALMPALIMGMYNCGYQHYLAIGQPINTFSCLIFGLLSVLPQIIVCYTVGLGIEFFIAQKKGHGIAEGFLVTGILIPMISPIDTPLWMIGVATAFAVIFGKEVFGGTGYNVFNVALVARAFLFFSYPSKMSGNEVFVRTKDTLGMGIGNVIDGYSGATPLGQIGLTTKDTFSSFSFTDVTNHLLSIKDMIVGLLPGSIGEVSFIAIIIGAILLIITGVASWKTMLSVFLGGAASGIIINIFAANTIMQMPFYYHFFLGGFAFGAIFMATDPVTSARTEKGKWIYGFLIGFLAIIIRVFNPGYPEGVMLAILFMNGFAPLIDFYVVEANIKKRLRRKTVKK